MRVYNAKLKCVQLLTGQSISVHNISVSLNEKSRLPVVKRNEIANLKEV